MYSPEHFALEQLAPGVYGAIARVGGWAISNAGFVDLGDLTVACDAFLTRRAAEELCRAAEELTGRPPDILVSTHYHNDHVWGSQALAPPAHAVASRRTRELMLTAGAEEQRSYVEQTPGRLEFYRARYRAAQTEEERRQAAPWVAYYEGLQAELPGLRPCLPDIAFDGRLEIHGSRRTAELIEFNGAHTASDVAVCLRDDGVIFMSDLLFVQCHPYLGDGDPYRLLKALNMLGSMGADCFVPGHGPVGSLRDLRLVTGYIKDCLDTARRVIGSGEASLEAVARLEVPEPYRHWMQPQFYQANIQSLCRRLGKAWVDEAEQL